MLQEMTNRLKALAAPWTVFENEKPVHRNAILQVLERAASDVRFIGELSLRGSEALRGYGLSLEEKAALISGDLRWLERHVGPLTKRQRTWPNCRLQQEAW